MELSPSQRARKRREQLGITQKHVAKACGVTQQAYEKFERGETKRPRYIHELAQILGISSVWLLTGKHKNDSKTEYLSLTLPSESRIDKGENVPVYSYHSEGKNPQNRFFDETRIIDQIETLPALKNTIGARALFIQGENLEDIYPHGTIIYLDLNKSPSKNNPSFYIDREGVYIATYLGSSDGHYHFKCLTTKKHKKIKNKDLNGIYRIAGAIYG